MPHAPQEPGGQQPARRAHQRTESRHDAEQRQREGNIIQIILPELINIIDAGRDDRRLQDDSEDVGLLPEETQGDAGNGAQARLRFFRRRGFWRFPQGAGGDQRNTCAGYRKPIDKGIAIVPREHGPQESGQQGGGEVHRPHPAQDLFKLPRPAIGPQGIVQQGVPCAAGAGPADGSHEGRHPEQEEAVGKGQHQKLQNRKRRAQYEQCLAAEAVGQHTGGQLQRDGHGGIDDFAIHDHLHRNAALQREEALNNIGEDQAMEKDLKVQVPNVAGKGHHKPPKMIFGQRKPSGRRSGPAS